MTTLLDGKVVLVTGGGSGIGRATCLVLAREGATVVSADLKLSSAQETINTLKDPSRHMALEMDVTSQDSVTNGLAKVTEKLKVTPTLLVNSAGVLRHEAFLTDTVAEFSTILDVNTKGTFLVCQLVANAMTNQGLAGSIVNIASIAGKVGYSGYASYCSSKGAIISLTKSIAVELASKGIRVNCVLPGIISTPMVNVMGSSQADSIIKVTTPLGRQGRPEEVAEVIAFLLSDRSSYMVGACVEVTGGAFM